MHFSIGSTDHSWQPKNTTDTTSTHYWLNWRVYLCALWILISMIIASFLIWKYEGKSESKEGERVQDEELSGVVYEDELWMPCLKVIHPIWLLAFRVLSFLLLLTLLVTNAVVDDGNIFLYYTQWTFMLTTVYFGLGSMLSMIPSMAGSGDVSREVGVLYLMLFNAFRQYGKSGSGHELLKLPKQQKYVPNDL